jgi:hypothetical protein
MMTLAAYVIPFCKTFGLTETVQALVASPGRKNSVGRIRIAADGATLPESIVMRIESPARPLFDISRTVSREVMLSLRGPNVTEPGVTVMTGRSDAFSVKVMESPRKPTLEIFKPPAEPSDKNQRGFVESVSENLPELLLKAALSAVAYVVTPGRYKYSSSGGPL